MLHDGPSTRLWSRDRRVSFAYDSIVVDVLVAIVVAGATPIPSNMRKLVLWIMITSTYPHDTDARVLLTTQTLRCQGVSVRESHSTG